MKLMNFLIVLAGHVAIFFSDYNCDILKMNKFIKIFLVAFFILVSLFFFFFVYHFDYCSKLFY